jgi:hypothetical protein
MDPNSLCGMRRIFSRKRFVLSGNFGNFLKSYLLNHCFRDTVSKKAVFEFLNQFTHFNHQFKLLNILHNPCHDSLDPFFPKSWDLDSRLGGCRTRVIDALFFNFLEDKSSRFKINLTLSLFLRFNLRLGGYSIWSASFIAPHIKEDLKTTRGMSTSQPQCSQGSTRKTPSR